MKERKSLDRLFQEKFKDFEVSPDEQVWKNIEAALHQKRKRRVIPIWWYQVAGVAALLLIGLFAWFNYMDTGSGRNPLPGVPAGPTVVNGQGEGVANGGSAVTPSSEAAPATKTGAGVPAVPAATTSSDGVATSRNEKHGIPLNETIRSVNGPKGDSPQRAQGTSDAVASGDASSPEKLNGSKSKKGTRTSPTAAERQAEPAVASSSKNTRTPEKKVDAIAAHNKTGNRSDRKTSANEPGLNGRNDGIADNSKDVKSSEGLTTGNPQDKMPITPEKGGSIEIKRDNTLPKTDAIAASTPADSAKIAEDTKKLEELLQPKNEKEEAIAGTKVDRWQVTTNVAPVYLGSASKAGSAIDPQFASNGKSYNSSTSYGVGLNYAVSKRLTVRAGLNKLNLSYNTNDVMFFAAISPPTLDAINPNPIGSFIQVMNPAEAHEGLENFELSIRDENMGVLRQEMGYYEVPLELSYKLLDRRFSISVIGGVSTLFLDQNSLSVQSPGMSARIGEANNLNQVHYSSNFGIGLRYRFLKSLELHCEPTLKYQINTFSGNDGNFRPYVVGVYSGLSFSF